MKSLHKEENFADTRARLELEGFAVKECSIAGDKCWLIFPPHMGIEWNEDNLIYRSGIWTDDGKPISLSWKKFFNWDERTDLHPKPENFDDCTIVNKEDGSTLLVSKFNGELIMRTRGSTDMEMLDNGYEKTLLIEKYAKFFNFIAVFPNTSYTYVFEWETPSNKIVIDYGDEPILVLTGMISNIDYSYIPNYRLDTVAEELELPRPPTYNFASFDDIQEVMSEIKGIEGVCVYFDDDQNIKKMKSDEYLMLHTVKFKLGLKALVELVYEENKSESEFKAFIERRFDYEGLKFVEGLIDQIYLADFTLKCDIENAYDRILRDHDPVDRKAFADIVFDKDLDYTKYSGFLFKFYEAGMPETADVLKAHASLREKFKKMIVELINE